MTTLPVTSPLATLTDPGLLKTAALINGEWVAGSSQFAVTDPATGAELARVANLGPAETEAALAAAHRAWPAWRNKTAKERGAILMKWFHLLHQHADDLARIMTLEQGKPLTEPRGEIALRRLLHRMVRRGSQAGLRRRHSPHQADKRTSSSRNRWACARPSPRGIFRRHDHPQGRRRAGRRLHDGGQARLADAVFGAGAV